MGVGLLGAKKLTDRFEIESSEAGTRVVLLKDLNTVTPVSMPDLATLGERLHRERPSNALHEVQQQNTDLVLALRELEAKQNDLSLLNQELAETNRGVVALYAELDEKASSLQKANEVKTSFLSNMTHEFRTPLTSIISLTRLLIEKIDGDLTSEQEKQVHYIRKSAEGLLELVGDLLDLAKVEAGRITLNVDDIEVNDILATLRGVFRPILAPDSKVELSVELLPESFVMHSDEGKIAQILRNLISNALKFTEAGAVTVTASMSDTDSVVFCVRDSGIGIEASDLERIFEDFSQVESKLQRKLRGTGLGLPLSRKLARLIGGDLWVESESGKGSSFFVKIPRFYKGENEGQLLNAVAPSAPQSPTAPAQGTHVPTLLLIDDDETSRYVLKNLLRSQLSAKVVETGSPIEGLKLALDVKPDLIFLDLSMPEQTGFDLIRLLKSNEATAEIPVCINTAKILTPDETDFLQQLSVGILSKERSNVDRSNSELKKALQDADVFVKQNRGQA